MLFSFSSLLTCDIVSLYENSLYVIFIVHINAVLLSRLFNIFHTITFKYLTIRNAKKPNNIDIA